MGSNIKKLEDLVRKGNFEEVQHELQKISRSDRKNLALIGNIAWRVQKPQLTVKVLNPIIKAQMGDEKSANPLELIEYAEGLRRMGVLDKAWSLLNEVDADQFPQAYLYRAFCLFNQWRYDEALPILRSYLAKDLDEYKRCVGEVNLAAALVQLGEFEEAQSLLVHLREVCQKAGYRLLYGNTLEISAQLFIFRHDYETALSLLQDAKGLLKEAGPLFTLFVEKWTAVAESLKLGRCTGGLSQVLSKAREIQHWESVRDCDLYISYLTQDWKRMEYLYFGTSFPCFRKRILKFIEGHFEMPETYIWSQNSSPRYLFNVSSGRMEAGGRGTLPMGQALHRFFILLCQDLYRPIPTATAFGRLFPGEFMNVQTSANRIHQIVKRCREWVAEQGLDLKIEESEKGYRLELGDNVGLVLSRQLPLDSNELEWLFVQKHVGTKVFDITEVRSILSSSTSKAHRLLRWALEQGRVERFGKGPGTTYLMLASKSF